MDTCSTSIIDLPKFASEADLLGMDKYERGLVRFIQKSRTPITVAIQGEWGSGKTSLMNSLNEDLCTGENAEFISIWMNTWQYSLMKDPEAALVSIIEGLTEEVLALIDDKSELARKVRSVFGSVMKATSTVAVRATTGQDISGVIDALSESRSVTVLNLRNSLNDAVAKILEVKRKKGFIFFIDDLDRIDPPVAVQILELLKNVFDLDSCLFVLAIDYDVVIKGLEPKFGKFTEANEREFRSFFDKIIQLPFTMPVSTYEINNFLISSLQNIRYLDQKQASDGDLIHRLSEVTRLSVGTNPRALKRMFNSLSLISCIFSDEEDQAEQDELTLFLNYALINLQIAYPKIYTLLLKEPDFPAWDERFAMSCNLPPLELDVLDKLKSQDEFDEEWEQVVYRASQKDYHLKTRVVLISQLLNMIRSAIPKGQSLGDHLESALSSSSVTSVDRVDNTKKNARKVSFICTDPDGKEYETDNLTGFCREHKIWPKTMRNIAKGLKNGTCKGWTCRLADS